jgi:hypothetical protein
MSFWHFFWKIEFWSIFVKLKLFWDQGTRKIFFHHFPISQVLNYSFMQKKLYKIILGALREHHLNIQIILASKCQIFGQKIYSPYSAVDSAMDF